MINFNYLKKTSSLIIGLALALPALATDQTKDENMLIL